VLSLLLTSWLPCFLKEAEATVANATAEGLSAEDLAIVEEATMAILSGCERGQLEVLRLKLAGHSDEHIAETLGLSRPTVSKRKRRRWAGWSRPVRARPAAPLAVLDQLGVRLEAGGGQRGEAEPSLPGWVEAPTAACAPAAAAPDRRRSATRGRRALPGQADRARRAPRRSCA
jgi:hypothetical protein